MAAPIGQVISRISRLSLATSVRTIHVAPSPLLFRATPVTCGEPLKKKKRVDVSLVLAREQKKRRKIEKQIRRLERAGRKLKPVDEMMPDYKLRRELEVRQRPSPVLAFEDAESRALLKKEWTRYKNSQSRTESLKIRLAEQSMTEALLELRAESEELYQMAIQTDSNLIPYNRCGPSRTPAITDYDPPDGDFTDTTKQF